MNPVFQFQTVQRAARYSVIIFPLIQTGRAANHRRALNERLPFAGGGVEEDGCLLHLRIGRDELIAKHLEREKEKV